MNLIITSADATANAWLDRMLARRAMTPPQARCYGQTHPKRVGGGPPRAPSPAAPYTAVRNGAEIGPGS